MPSPDTPSTVSGRDVSRYRRDRGSSSLRATFTPPVVLASTVLALLAAGGVLWFAVGNSAGSSAVPPGFDDTDTTAGPGDTATGVDLFSPGPAPENPDDALGVAITAPDSHDTTTLASVQGDKPMVVNFFASWCAPCIAEMPDFEAVSQQVLDDVDVIGIAFQDRGEDAADIVDHTGVTYPWYRDIAGDLLIALGGIQMPSTAFVTADGTVAEMKPGVLSRGELRDRIERHFGVAP